MECDPNYAVISPYFTAWQSVAYGEIDPPTMLNLTNCCKLFLRMEFKDNHEKAYWKRQIFNEFKLRKGESISKIEIVWKDLFRELKGLESIDTPLLLCCAYELDDPYPHFLSKLEPNAKTLYYSGCFNISIEDHQASANLGFAPAQAIVACKYGWGIRIDHNLNEKFKYYQLSAAQNNVNGQIGLGECYEHGHGVDKQESEAFKYYLISANRKNARAQFCVGNCYHNGIGVEKDPAKAFEYYQLSAYQGYHEGMLGLSECYENGIGVPKDSEKAAEWNEKGTIAQQL